MSVLTTKKGSALAAGFDLCSACDMVVEAGNKAMVPTGLSIVVPSGTYGRVAPRSGLAVKISSTLVPVSSMKITAVPSMSSLQFQ